MLGKPGCFRATVLACNYSVSIAESVQMQFTSNDHSHSETTPTIIFMKITAQAVESDWSVWKL